MGSGVLPQQSLAKRTALRALHKIQYRSDALSQFLTGTAIGWSSLKHGKETLPLKVAIENTNVCNARCITCAMDIMQRKTGFMDMELFRKIVDDCAAEGIQHVSLNFFGEAFIDPKIFDRIEYAKSKGLYVHLQSNASLLTAEKTDRLLTLGLDEFQISIDGATKETFERVRVRLKWEDVVNNTEYFLKQRQAGGYTKPTVCVRMVLIEDNESERDKFFEMWNDKVQPNGSVHVSNPFNWGGKKQVVSHHKTVRSPCARLWLQLVVLQNGDVALCCNDYDGEVVVGNMREQSVREVWQGEPLRKIREHHLRREFDKVSICANCENYYDWF